MKPGDLVKVKSDYTIRDFAGRIGQIICFYSRGQHWGVELENKDTVYIFGPKDLDVLFEIEEVPDESR